MIILIFADKFSWQNHINLIKSLIQSFWKPLYIALGPVAIRNYWSNEFILTSADVD